MQKQKDPDIAWLDDDAMDDDVIEPATAVDEDAATVVAADDDGEIAEEIAEYEALLAELADEKEDGTVIDFKPVDELKKELGHE